MSALHKDETLTASTAIQASGQQVYDVVSDITRIPQWSPDVVRAEWLSAYRFRTWNRRGIGLWRNTSEVVEAEPGSLFSYTVQALGNDWSQWTFTIQPSTVHGLTNLVVKYRMCVSPPRYVKVSARLIFFGRDRRASLQANLDSSADRIQRIAEEEANNSSSRRR